MDRNKMKATVEAILFTMGDAVDLDRIAKAMEWTKEETKSVLEELANEYESADRGIRIIELDGRYQMCTNKDMYEDLIKIASQPKKHVLTDVLLETLSIIAYKQPVTKTEIENIRGVSCDHAVSKLVEYNLVTELGRLDAPGRPMLFGTTEEFLRSFGVHTLDELPEISPVQVEEFKMEAEKEAAEELGIDEKEE
ncbi:MAG: SMC-Scp complex subunit ScpB [Lachnospiraceae bacterium]|nr:SMC-Scp complex subunit ScpB [Lachnospiraceae bacterium]